MTWVALALLVLGGLMAARGTVYGLWPEGPIAKKRQQRNLRRGFTTDMKAFGRRVRRLGVLLALIALTVLGWPQSFS